MQLVRGGPLAPGALAVLLLLAAGTAAARERAAILGVGRSAGASKIVADALRDRFDLVAVPAALRNDLEAAAGGDGDLGPELHAALAAARLDAVVVVAAGRAAFHVVIFETARGTRVLDHWQRSRRGIDEKRLRSEVRGAIATVVSPAPPPVATPPPAARPSSPASPSVAARAPAASPRAREESSLHLRARLLGGLAARSFSFHQPLSSQLRDYSLPATPSLRGQLELYPLGGGAGLVGSYATSPDVKSSVEDSGQTLPSSFTEWQAGAALRLPVRRIDVTLMLLWGRLDFSFPGAPGSLAAELPAVRYEYGRVAVAAAVPVAPRWVLRGELGGRTLLSSGALGTRFPHGTSAGIDGRLGAGYDLGSGFALLAEASYAHHFHDFRSVPGDASVAGGALDLYGSLDMGVQVAF